MCILPELINIQLFAKLMDYILFNSYVIITLLFNIPANRFKAFDKLFPFYE